MKNSESILIYFSIGISLLYFGCEKEPKKVIDVDGNIYNTVTIGTQVWLKENLKTTKLNDGTDVPYVTSDTEWEGLSTSGYCYYANSWTNRNLYGALYNWHTVNTGKLCPSGWHVPTNEEWSTLITYLGGDTLVGGKLKSTSTFFWDSPNRGATNETGFSALAGGLREPGGSFEGIKEGAFFWSYTEHKSWGGIFIELSGITSNPIKTYAHKTCGMSVRCVRD